MLLERRVHTMFKADRGYEAIQAIHGVGRAMAAILVAGIGDISRFRSPKALCSWARLPPPAPPVSTRLSRGDRLVRWAARTGRYQAPDRC